MLKIETYLTTHFFLYYRCLLWDSSKKNEDLLFVFECLSSFDGPVCFRWRVRQCPVLVKNDKKTINGSNYKIIAFFCCLRKNGKDASSSKRQLMTFCEGAGPVKHWKQLYPLRFELSLSLPLPTSQWLMNAFLVCLTFSF